MPNIGDSDDDWAELARELSRDKPQTPVEPPVPSEEMGLFGEDAEAMPVPDEGGDSPETAGEYEGEGAPDGQPGTGRKRRRRRRRRRRGGVEEAGEAPAAGAPETEDSGPGESTEEEPAEIAYSDEDDSDLALVESDSSTDEDAGEELLRDLIANWNVPSWDDVVGGLYRPDR